MQQQTLAQKILAAHVGKDQVTPGEFLYASLDLVLANDITAPIAIMVFRSLGADKVWDQNKIALVPDHSTPNKDIKAAEQSKLMREFAREYGIVNYFEVGRIGIEHVLLPDEGLVLPGDLVIGADSHTCTYGALGAFSTGVGSTDAGCAMATGKVWLKVPETLKFNITGQLPKWSGGKDIILYTIGKIGVDGALYCAMEYTGDTITGLDMAGRFTISNMAIEAGGKAGLIAADEKTLEYVKPRARRDYHVYSSDEGAEYKQIFDWKAEDIVPQVAFPHLPENTQPIDEVEKQRIQIDQSVIGSCTNGRIEDLRLAAEVLKGRKIDPSVRALIFPGTQQIVLQAAKEGLLDIFIEAGAAFSTPTCGPCLGGHCGVLATGERAISTTNRNFVGRMGHTSSEVYLANPAVAAASAIAGYICSPDSL